MTSVLFLTLMMLPSNPRVLENSSHRTVLEVEAREDGRFGRLFAVPGAGFDVHILSVEGSNPTLSVGKPMTLRGIRIVSLSLSGFRRATLEIRYDADPMARDPRKASPDFERLFKSILVNYRPPDGPIRGRQGEGARYLVITGDEFQDAISPLVEWKHRKGMEAHVATTAEIGSSLEEIKDYIQTAYDTWDIPPEYVLLVGDEDVIPTRLIHDPWAPGSYYYDVDNYYATLDGDDYLADVFVGRISVTTEEEAQTVTAKVLGLERNPYLDDPDWFRKASLLAGDAYEGCYTYRDPKIAARDMMLTAGYLEVDTFFVYEDPGWPTGADVIEAIDEGRTYVNFRGASGGDFPAPFQGLQPLSVYNGFKLPVVFAVTCLMGGFHNDPAWTDERWLRAGTPEEPKGAAGFFATSSCVMGGHEHTVRRNALDEGIFIGLFEDSLSTFGEATIRGRLSMLEQYPEPESLAQYTYEGHNILGDPEMILWTDTPESLEVEHPEALFTGAPSCTLTVRKGGTPLAHALVCLRMDTLVYEWGYTDASGEAILALNLAEEGLVDLTVTGMNAVPYEGRIIAVSPTETPTFST